MAIARDLMTVSRLESLVAGAGGSFDRVDRPADLPPAAAVDLLLVDWSERDPGWGAQLTAWRDGAVPKPRIILFGPHTDLDAHAAAREAGLGPMKARSALAEAISPRRLPTDRGSR